MNLSEVCGNGHDLTVEDAFVYSARGFRACRECVQPKKKQREVDHISRWSS
jgi:hypothetical protein